MQQSGDISSDMTIVQLGDGHIDSPLSNLMKPSNFVKSERILIDIEANATGRQSVEIAGPSQKIYWNPTNVRVAIVTCGGIAPGLNNVIQSIVQLLADRYKVQHIFGVPFGYFGFQHNSETKRFRFGWSRLDSQAVQSIHVEAGSVLGTSRGHTAAFHIVDALSERNIDILFTLGGEGTLAGAKAIHDEILKRDLKIAVVGIPKTIDNDVPWVSKSFGFETAVGKASEALRCAQAEARSAFHGIGLVQIMGRHSGALTAYAAATVNDLDFAIVPEVELCLDGPNGFLNQLTNRVLEKGYATIAVAEGAGQSLIANSTDVFDASGNLRPKNIGLFLKAAIEDYFESKNLAQSLKYIDPSYMLRSQVTSADDALFCQNLGQNAVHAAMAGKTGCMIGYIHEQFVNVPLSALEGIKKRLDTNGPLWLSVLASTGQPRQWV